MWNPSLRKTLSHPAAVHKVVRGVSQDGQSTSAADTAHLAPSKSVKHSSRSKLAAQHLQDPGTTDSGGAVGGGASSPGRVPSKKGSLFEGFRNTLRPRGKSGDPTNGGLCTSHSLDRSGEAASSGTKGVIRRWSEITPNSNPAPAGES